jgi:putative FmdB family regulatory protein
MPIYEYKCNECENHFEAMQKMTEDPLKVCEKCGGKLEKQWSLSGFQLKGEGWYLTDYAKKGKDSASVAGNPSSGDSATSSEFATTEKSSEKSAEKSSTTESTKSETPASKETATKVSKTE